MRFYRVQMSRNLRTTMHLNQRSSGGRSKAVFGSLLAAVSFLYSMTLGSAAVIFNNLNEALVSDDQVNSSAFSAQQFSVQDSGVYLSSIQLNLGAVGGSGNLILSLYDNDGSVPGSLLHSLVTTAVSGLTVNGVNAFTPSQYTLQAGTYWIVASCSDSAQVNWTFTDSSSGTGSGFSMNSAIFSDSSWNAYSDQPYRMQLEAVPEPAPILAGTLLMVSCGFHFVNQRRRDKVAGA